MFNDVNLREALMRERELARQKGAADFVYDIFNVLNEEVYIEHSIRNRVGESRGSAMTPKMKIQALDEERLFSIDEIRKICIKYRLRFLDSALFKGELPHEAVSKVKELEKVHECELENFKIVAPTEMFTLSDCDQDPLLFVQLDNGIYYLVHQWGKDMSWFRQLAMFPARTTTTLAISVLIISVLIGLLIPTQIIETSLTGDAGMARVTFFLWSFVSILACVSFAAVSLCKNVSASQWNSPFFKKNH